MTSSQVFGLIFVLLIVGVGVGGYSMGYSEGKDDEIAANAAAMRELNRQLSERNRELYEAEQNRLKDVAKLEQTVNDLQQSADQDATAARPAVSVDGVRRLNQVR